MLDVASEARGRSEADREARAANRPILIKGRNRNAVLMSVGYRRSILGTLHLPAIPGMKESIKQGLRAPIGKCKKGIPWRHMLAAFCALILVLFEGVVMAEEETKRMELTDWVMSGSVFEPVSRTTERLPLSDQQNRGTWVPYPAMTDEFAGGVLDPMKWIPRNPGWKGRQPGYFWTGNVAVKDGFLELTARKQEVPEMPKSEGYHTWTTAAVQSQGVVKYGYFEIRARPMKSAASSGFWFYKNDKDYWTEIDVFEICGAPGVSEADVVQPSVAPGVADPSFPWAAGVTNPDFPRIFNMNIHVFHTPKDRIHRDRHAEWRAPFGYPDGFHVYGLEWDKKELKWFVDGVLVREVENREWHQPLTLNFDSETMPGWMGLPRDSDLPSTFSIDYVRAWIKEGDK